MCIAFLRFQSSSPLPLALYKKEIITTAQRGGGSWFHYGSCCSQVSERILLEKPFACVLTYNKSLKTNSLSDREHSLSTGSLRAGANRDQCCPGPPRVCSATKLHTGQNNVCAGKRNLCSVISNYNNENALSADGRRHHHHRRPRRKRSRLVLLLCFCLSVREFCIFRRFHISHWVPRARARFAHFCPARYSLFAGAARPP